MAVIEGSLDTLQTLPEWLASGRRIVAATLVDTEGSAPLDPGATMLVDAEATIEGSVTGGCVDGALVEEALTVLGGGPPAIKTYGITDEVAGSVGLMCGGTVHVFVREIEPADAELWEALSAAIGAGAAAGVATVLDGPTRGRTATCSSRRSRSASSTGWSS